MIVPENDEISTKKVWLGMSGQQANGEGSMEGYDTGGRNGSAGMTSGNTGAPVSGAPMIGNINSPSVSLASVSSGEQITFESFFVTY